MNRIVLVFAGAVALIGWFMWALVPWLVAIVGKDWEAERLGNGEIPLVH